MRTPRLFFIILLGLMMGQAVYYYPRLPDIMASHFGVAGNVNGWMPKGIFFVFEFVTEGILAFLFLVFPGFIIRLPAERINLPNKVYWLDPVRKSATGKYIQEAMLWQGNALFFLLLIVFQMVMESNLNHFRRLPIAVLVLVIIGFIVFNILWTIVFIRKFSIIRKDDRGRNFSGQTLGQ